MRIALVTILWFALIFGGLLFLGADRHPLLVQAVTTGDQAKANMLVTPCGLDPMNIPILNEDADA